MNRPGITAAITIGLAEETDYNWCAQLMATSEPWITLRRGLEQCHAALRRPRAELFVAREGERRLGFILFDPYGLAASPYIATVAVDEPFRGRGVGSRLLDFVEQRMAGRRFIFLCVSSFNRRAQELYHRRSYQRVGEIPNYFVEGHSELLLAKKLA